MVSTGFPGDVEGSREDSGPDSEGAGFVDDNDKEKLQKICKRIVDRHPEEVNPNINSH